MTYQISFRDGGFLRIENVHKIKAPEDGDLSFYDKNNKLLCMVNRDEYASIFLVQ